MRKLVNTFSVCFLSAALLFSGCVSTGVKTADAPVEKAHSEGATPVPEFILGVGDSLDISIYRNDDLKTSTKINPGGTIMFPLIGEVQAAGKGLSAFKDELAGRYSRYLVDPQISISVTSVQSRRILVMGEVNTPGALVLDRDLTILDAMASAGGWNHDANLGNVILLRIVSGKVEARTYDMSAVIDGRAVSDNQLLQKNDIIYVPTKKIANIARYMTYLSSIISPLVLTEGGIVLGPQVIDALNGKKVAASAIVTH